MKMKATPDVRAATFELLMKKPLNESSNIKTCAFVLEFMVQKVT